MNHIRLTTSEAVKFAAVSRSKFYQHVKEGELPRPYKNGRKNYWLQHEVEAALKKLHEEKNREL